MADLLPQRLNIQIEESRFRYAVAESVIQKIGAAINLINKRQFQQKEFFLNGPYGQVAVTPQNGLDGLYVFPFAAEIINVAMFNLDAGSAGTTELDVKRATSSGGAFTSIFTTTPKITSAAGANTFFPAYVIADATAGQTFTPNPSLPTGCSGGILSTVPFQVNQGDAIRVDILSSMTGGQNAGLIIFHRPIS